MSAVARPTLAASAPASVLASAEAPPARTSQHPATPWALAAWNSSLLAAAKKGDEPAVRYWLARGATEPSQALIAAAGGGHEAIVRHCKAAGGAGFSEASRVARDNGHAALAELCMAWRHQQNWELEERYLV